MTVTKLKTAERLAPTPKPGSYVHAIFTTVEALGGRATCREIRELLPAANGPSFTDNRSCHEHVKSIAVNLGYLGCDAALVRGGNTPHIDESFGKIEYFINTFEVYDSKRIERLARAEKKRKKRAAKRQRQQAAAEKQAEQTAKQEATDRIATARQKLTPVSTRPTKPATIDPTPKTIHADHNTRMEYAIVAATASVISVGVYVLLGQVL
jgi:hypothetical protein